MIRCHNNKGKSQFVEVCSCSNIKQQSVSTSIKSAVSPGGKLPKKAVS